MRDFIQNYFLYRKEFLYNCFTWKICFCKVVFHIAGDFNYILLVNSKVTGYCVVIVKEYVDCNIRSLLTL